MPISGDGIIEAVFDTGWAGVDIIVDGAAWPSTVDTITINRVVAGEADIPLRGVERLPVVGGFWVGTDHEGPLESSITYRVDGYLDTVFVASATVTESTAGAEWGVWLKVAGRPGVTVLAETVGIGAIDSDTQGGVYLIAGGGGSVSQSVANWSGVSPDTTSLTFEVLTTEEVARLAAVLAHRVLLIQTGAPELLPSGFYFVRRVSATMLSPLVSPARRVVVDLTRTGIPAGDGTGIAGLTWATVFDTYATWTALATARATWFDVLKDS